MAEGKKFDLKHPGGKEFLIIGGAAVGLGLLYFWWKNRQTAAAGQGTGQGSGGGGHGVTSPTGFLSAWIHDHQSSPSATDKDKDTDTDKGKGSKTHTVPNVVGMTDTAADARIEAAGLVPKDANERKGGSGGTTKVVSQSPPGGTKVAAGSDVTITLATPTRRRKDTANAHG